MMASDQTTACRGCGEPFVPTKTQIARHSYWCLACRRKHLPRLRSPKTLAFSSFPELIRLPLPDPHSCTSEDAGTRDRAALLFRCVPLTHGHITLVGAQDYEWIAQRRWNSNGNRQDKRRYAKNENTFLHRLIMERVLGRPLLNWKIEQVDHKNGDGLDNRRPNLRICSQSQNGANSKKAAPCSSQFKGVVWQKHRNKWSAKISVNGKHYHLGNFVDEEDAATAYDVAARRLRGDFARLNFPQSITPPLRLNDAASRKTSIYRGVSWDCRKARWRAEAQKDRRKYHIGYFQGELDAARAYDARVRGLYGHNAYLNFPKPAQDPAWQTFVQATGLVEV